MALIGEMDYLTIGGNTYSIPKYSLPIASASTLGGVRVGTGLTIESGTGILSATGTDVTIDSEMSDSSHNPVQNQTIKAYIDQYKGTVTSVRVQATSPVQSSVSTAQNETLNTTISLANGYGDTKNPYGTKTANYVLAGPTTGTATAPTFRKLVAADIPDLSETYLTSYTETDPTVPSWAKASTKPSYTASEVGAASSSHTHGNITNGGDITATAPTIANGDQIIINDNSASKITNGPTFDGSTTTTALTPKGTWESFSKFSGSYNDLSNKPTIPTVPTAVSAFTNDAGYITSADVPEGASAYTGTISAVGTTASSGTNNGFARGDHVHNITSSTITSALGYTPYDSTNPNGYISSYTDEKLKWTASTTSNTYYPLQSTSTATTSTANTLNGISFYQYYNTAGGYRRLNLGNSTAYKSSGGAYGTIRLYGAAATYYGDLVPGVLGTTSGDGHISANRTWTLPDKTGTIALISDIPTTLPASDVSAWAKAASKPTYTASEVGALASNTTYVSTVTTTAGTHTTISSKSGAVSFNVPTKTSHLTNDSGFITSDSDENVKSTTVTAATTNYIVGSTSSSTATGGLSKHASALIYTTADSGTSGYSELRLGNTTATSSAGGKEGRIRLYGTNATYYVTLVAGAIASSNKTITFPNATGTVALTSDIPTIPTKTSDLTNDSGFITFYTETDPVFSASAASEITSSNISTWNDKYTKPSGGVPKTDLASTVQTSLGLADTALQSFTETDPTVPSWAKQSTKPSYTASEISGLMDFFYPVGSYYETSDTTFDPNVSWGGTWDLETEGQVHVSAGSTYTAGSSYGSDTHTHTTGDLKLTDEQIAHGHGMTQPAFTIAKEGMTSTGMSANESHAHYDGTNSSGIFGVVAGNTTCQVTASANSGRATTSTSTAHTHKVPSAAYSVPRSTNAAVTNLSGASSTRTAHNHGETGSSTRNSWQPSVAVNRWHRTA